jgi:hypothetical protein
MEDDEELPEWVHTVRMIHSQPGVIEVEPIPGKILVTIDAQIFDSEKVEEIDKTPVWYYYTNTGCPEEED